MRRATFVLPFAASCVAALCLLSFPTARVTAIAGAAEPPGATASAGEEPRALGVVVAPAERSGGARTLRAVGQVVPDEARVYSLNAGMDGSIRDVAPVVTGSRVRKDQVLGSYYAPGALMVLQKFIMNRFGYDPSDPDASRPDGGGKSRAELDAARRQASLYKANIQQRVMELENMGVSALQREEIARDGRMPDTIKIVAPVDGLVLARNVSPGLKFKRGFELYRIADLRKVWVLADVFLEDARHLRAGMPARVCVPEQRLELPATIAEILPRFDPTTRTLRVRLVVANPTYALRPGTFVDVRLEVALPPAVVVPAGAVVDSGLSKTVYVRSAGGLVEPRRVRTGWRSGDRVEIVEGLAPGEQVVASGTFFLDSETRMRSPRAGAVVASGEPAQAGPHGR